MELTHSLLRIADILSPTTTSSSPKTQETAAPPDAESPIIIEIATTVAPLFEETVNVQRMTDESAGLAPSGSSIDDTTIAPAPSFPLPRKHKIKRPSLKLSAEASTLTLSTKRPERLVVAIDHSADETELGRFRSSGGGSSIGDDGSFIGKSRLPNGRGDDDLSGELGSRTTLDTRVEAVVNLFSSREEGDEEKEIFGSRNRNITSGTDYCKDFPCYNNGTCRNLPPDAKNASNRKPFECQCTEDWSGELCLEVNFCVKNPCQNGATCRNGENAPFCECTKDYAGENCERHCPSYLCLNEGRCQVDANGGYYCKCVPGWTGIKCEHELDECRAEKETCLNGGTCIDKFNGFDCNCSAGFMGPRCHRPCQDIYQSCTSWADDNKCESMESTTKFFGHNCAKSCGKCIFDNSTGKNDR
uniref:Uncharacterized protein n=1 Tax=Romanomermis culicivorax TaxID=13658 RepID=A0A915KGD4_ROMCU